MSRAHPKKSTSYKKKTLTAAKNRGRLHYLRRAQDIYRQRYNVRTVREMNRNILNKIRQELMKEDEGSERGI